jgi:hypothetical protein
MILLIEIHVEGGPQRVQGRALVEGPGGGAKPPGSSGGLRNYIHLFERQFEPTTPFLSDQKNLTLSLNFVG